MHIDIIESWFPLSVFYPKVRVHRLFVLMSNLLDRRWNSGLPNFCISDLKAKLVLNLQLVSVLNAWVMLENVIVLMVQVLFWIPLLRLKDRPWLRGVCVMHHCSESFLCFILWTSCLHIRIICWPFSLLFKNTSLYFEVGFHCVIFSVINCGHCVEVIWV